MQNTAHALLKLTSVRAILVLCLTYALVGRLSLMLAIPPGYATAIFPPAGIAVAALLFGGYRLWPGIFLGSALLNLWISVEQAPLTVSSLLIALSAASGAALQGLAGAWLVRRVVGFPTSLSTEQEIFWFMLFAGPVACLINASFGSTSLLAAGVIDSTEYAYSWFTWWVGDTIGVLIMAPLMLIFFYRQNQLWRSRRSSVAVPLLFMLSAVIGLFLWVNKLEYERTQFDFKEIASDTADKLRASFNSYLETVTSIERFFASSEYVTRKEFQTFVKNSLLTKPGIQGLGWNPVVLHSERESFEQSIRQQGFADFQISQRDSKGEIVSATQRNDYVVVNYLEPLSANLKALGFDVASNDERNKALLEARHSGLPVATARITLVQEKGQQAGFLLFYPVYKAEHQTQQQRIQNIAGYAVGVFRIGDIVDQVLSRQIQDQFVLGIYDKEVSVDNNHLYGPENFNEFADGLYQWNASLSIGEREWALYFKPSTNYLAEHRSWQAWVVLAAGLLFTSMFGAFLLAMTGRSYQVERLVTLRTAELSGILSTALETIITTDENGRIESINPAGEALFGYTAEELLGQSISTVLPDFFDFEANPNNPTESPPVGNSRRDLNAVRKDNSKVAVEIAISTLTVFEKTHYTAIIHDLTERTKINRMKEEFVSTVSHELRTPLTSIKGTLGLLAGGVLGEMPEKTKSLLAVSYENSERLESLINELLDINKIHSNDTPLQMKPININNLINQAIRANQGFADKYRITLVWQPGESGEVMVNADQNRMDQVLANLLSNAIKYSPKDAQVLVTTSRHNENVRVSVSDSGPGIPLEFQQKVFERFTQADSSDTRRVGGTGLGLAITKTIIDKHSGQIDFTSNPGEGTVFFFELKVVNQ